MTATLKNRRTDRLVARVTPDDKALLEHAAMLEGMSVASFVVSHIRVAAEKLIREHEVIRLDAKESRRFVEALLAPPCPPSKRMKDALLQYRKTVSER